MRNCKRWARKCIVCKWKVIILIIIVWFDFRWCFFIIFFFWSFRFEVFISSRMLVSITLLMILKKLKLFWIFCLVSFRVFWFSFYLDFRFSETMYRHFLNRWTWSYTHVFSLSFWPSFCLSFFESIWRLASFWSISCNVIFSTMSRSTDLLFLRKFSYAFL